jgi:hypothetical protein
MAWLHGRLHGLLCLCPALALAGCTGDIIESASEFGDEVEAESDDESSTGSEAGSGSSSESSTTESSTTDSTSESTSDTTGESTSDTTGESTSESTSSTTESTSESTSETGSDACESEMSFLIPAVNYTSAYGWQPYMSMIGEGMVLDIPDGVTEAVAEYELDIPCDDTWHVWVRALDYQQYDSLWVRVDETPVEWAIFEVDCTDGPMESMYKWNELNWRVDGANPCQYVEDPWTQEWTKGIHTLELGYRDSVAISKIWFTNGNGTPP